MRKTQVLPILILMTCLSIGVAPAAWADGVQTLLQGFEGPGLPAGWTVSTGDYGVSGQVEGIGPTQGSQFAVIDNCGGPSAPCANMSFTGVPGAFNGTWLLSPSFTLGANQAISFDVNFLSNEYGGFADFAYVELIGSNQAILFTANTINSTFLTNSPSVISPPGFLYQVSPGVSLSTSTASFDGNVVGPLNGITYGPENNGRVGGATGWITSSYTPGPGTYDLFFVVSNQGDPSVPTALAIDNIEVTTVPEPNTMILLGFGLFGIICLKRAP